MANSDQRYTFSLDYSNFFESCNYPTPLRTKVLPCLGSIGNIVQQLKYYLHAKFGAFTPKCTIFHHMAGLMREI